MTDQETSYASSGRRDSKNVDLRLQSLKPVRTACGNCSLGREPVLRPGFLRSLFRNTHLLAELANIEKVTTKKHCIKFGSVKFCEIKFCELVETICNLSRTIEVTAKL
jgi:hypothetical protein